MPPGIEEILIKIQHAFNNGLNEMKRLKYFKPKNMQEQSSLGLLALENN